MVLRRYKLWSRYNSTVRVHCTPGRPLGTVEDRPDKIAGSQDHRITGLFGLLWRSCAGSAVNARRPMVGPNGPDPLSYTDCRGEKVAREAGREPERRADAAAAFRAACIGPVLEFARERGPMCSSSCSKAKTTSIISVSTMLCTQSGFTSSGFSGISLGMSF